MFLVFHLNTSCNRISKTLEHCTFDFRYDFVLLIKVLCSRNKKAIAPCLPPVRASSMHWHDHHDCLFSLRRASFFFLFFVALSGLAMNLQFAGEDALLMFAAKEFHKRLQQEFPALILGRWVMRLCNLDNNESVGSI